MLWKIIRDIDVVDHVLYRKIFQITVWTTSFINKIPCIHLFILHYSIKPNLMTPPIVFQVQCAVTIYIITVIYLFCFVPLRDVKQSTSHTVILPYTSKGILLRISFNLRYFKNMKYDTWFTMQRKIWCTIEEINRYFLTIINTNTSTDDLNSILRILYHYGKLDYKETIDLKLHIITWECTY